MQKLRMSSDAASIRLSDSIWFLDAFASNMSTYESWGPNLL